MSILLHKPYLEKWSTKGGQNIQKKLSTWFMDNPLETFPSFDVANTSKTKQEEDWLCYYCYTGILVCSTPLLTRP